jgi:hypothetical protein
VRRSRTPRTSRRSGSGPAGFRAASPGSRRPGIRTACRSSGRSGGAAAPRCGVLPERERMLEVVGAFDPLGEVGQTPAVRDEPERARELAFGVVDVALLRVRADDEHRNLEPEPEVVDHWWRNVVVDSPHSSQVRKIAVCAQSSLCITALTTSVSQLCAKHVLSGGWSQSCWHARGGAPGRLSALALRARWRRCPARRPRPTRGGGTPRADGSPRADRWESPGQGRCRCSRSQIARGR